MSVLLTDDFDLIRLGLQPGDHKHLIIEALTEEEFVEKVTGTSFISIIGSAAKAAYLTEILGHEVTATPHSQSLRPVEPMTDDDTLYVASFTTSRDRREPGLREVREGGKNYFRVFIDPMVMFGIAIPLPGFSSTLRTAY
jgi:hypothetical protein